MSRSKRAAPMFPIPAELSALPPYLTVADVARITRKTPKAVRNAIDRGQVPGVIRPFGQRCVLVLRDALLESLAVSSAPSRES